jgi:catechol 2,3-dioxygenase-like lactoylglutathione lyase family enzyme
MLGIGLVTLVVRDYDEAIRYYVEVLGFRLLEDREVSPSKRWIVVAPTGQKGTALLLAKAATDDQAVHVGNQTGGRVFLFLYSDNFARDHKKMKATGVTFIESPRHEDYGTVAKFEDLYGNRWDLIEPARSS